MSKLLIYIDFILFNCILQKHIHPIDTVSHLPKFATHSAGQLLCLFILLPGKQLPPVGFGMDEQILAISEEENTRSTEISWYSHSSETFFSSDFKRQGIESECLHYSLMWVKETGLVEGSISHKQLTGHFSINGMLLYLKIHHSDFLIHLYLSPRRHLIIVIWY